EVASRIKAELRMSDALGRVKDEAFAVLLIDADLDSASMVAERIRAGIAGQPFLLPDGEMLTVSVSIGVATLADDEREHTIEAVAQRLLAQADEASHEARDAGRNRAVVQP